MKPIILFACPQMDLLARRIVVAQGSHVVAGQIDWKYFDDGWPDFKIEIGNEDDLRGYDVAFLAAFENPHDSVVQRWVMNAFRYFQARSLTIILPYFPTGTMERTDKKGRIVTAKSLARDLSSIPSCACMQNRLVIWDIHALPEWFTFEGHSVLPILTSAIPLLKARIDRLPYYENVSIVFPDEGAQKRFGGQFYDFPHIICDKHREGDKRIITLKEGAPRGRDCLIVDDLMLTGETQDACAKVVSAGGAKTISMYVTHLVAPKQSWRRFCNVEYPLEHFWYTDSCTSTHAEIAVLDRRTHPFEVLSLQGQITSQVLGVRDYFEN